MDLNINKKVIYLAIFFIISLIVIFSIYSIFTTIDRKDKVKLSIIIAPSSAEITLKDTSSEKTYTAKSGENYFPAGKYEVTAVKEGFSTYSETVDIPTKYNNELLILLTPESEEAIAWSKANQAEYQKVEAAAGKQFFEHGKEFSEKYPELSKLPVKDSYYSIGHYVKDDRPVIVITTESPQYRYRATAKLVSLGIKLSDYQVEYANFKSPLGD